MHTSVVDDHVVELNTVVFVFLCDVTAGTQEKTISQFPGRSISI